MRAALPLCLAGLTAVASMAPAAAESSTDQGKIACAAKMGFLWNAKKRRYDVPKESMDAWKKCVVASGSFID